MSTGGNAGTTDFSPWIGRSQETSDIISRNLAVRIATTLSRPAPASGGALPPLWHWAYFQEPVNEEELGPDGHPTRGTFLPPADNRNRMWAGGDVEFFEPLQVDAPATRTSTITDVKEKTGRTGSLLFVTLVHETRQGDTLNVREVQNVVYRAPSPPKLKGEEMAPPADWQQTVRPSETMLFRYSAVTFNAHRIHYDHPYVTEAEGYPGLVVHGPMIATLMCQAFVDANPTARLARMTYRGLRPLIAPTPFQVGGRIVADGQAELWAANDDGVAHRAELRFTV